MKRFIRPVALTCHELHAAGDLAAAIRIRAGAHSFEGKDFNIVSSVCLDKTLFEALRGLDPEAGETPELSHRSVSMVLVPTGEPIKDTLCETEGLLDHDIDIAQCVEPKQFHDVVGYYTVSACSIWITRTRLKPITIDDVARATWHPEIAGDSA